jgi:LysM repeat protein
MASPALALTPPTPATSVSVTTNNTTIAPVATAQTPSGPIQPDLAPPADTAPVAISPTAPLAAGPVHMPPANADASIIHHTHQTYIVKITDSYKKIAHAHHITVAQLKEANHISGNVLHTGQKLFIPSEKSEVAESTSAATSTLSSAPTTTVSSITTAPMTTGLTSTTTTEPMVEHHHTYTVVKGDTLSKIAHKFHLTTSTLMAANDSVDARKLRIGQKLHIPSQGPRSANIAAPAPAVAQPEVPKAQPEPAEIQPVATPSAQLANFMP